MKRISSEPHDEFLFGVEVNHILLAAQKKYIHAISIYIRIGVGRTS